MADEDTSNKDHDVSRDLDPTGEHDTEALKEAARKMHIEHEAAQSLDDPTGEHDPAALEEVARKMGLKR